MCWMLPLPPTPTQRNTMVLNPPLTPSLKNCLQESASTGQGDHISAFLLSASYGGRGRRSSQMSMTAVVLARLPQRGRPLGPPTRGTGPLWKHNRPSVGRALCSDLPGGGCKPSDPRADPPASLCPKTSPN